MHQFSLDKSAEEWLDSVLGEKGFRRVRASSNSVTYQAGQRVIELSYYPEDGQQPVLNVAVALDERGTRSVPLVALWRAYPEVLEIRESTHLAFDSDERLSAVLRHVGGSWIDRYVLPLLADPARLSALWKHQVDESHDHYSDLVRTQQLQRARRLFDDGDLAGAANAFQEYGEAELGAGDRRKLAVALKSRGTNPSR